MQEIEGHLSVLGPFEWTDPEADPEDFIARMRHLMVDELARVRGAETDPAPGLGPTQAPDPAPAAA
jgi:hypothetical protein